MKKRKTFIVGDVHGCFQEFSALLKKVNYKIETHRLILVGDIINRGPFSLKMLKWVKDNKIEMVRGNHEQAFLTGIETSQWASPLLKQLKEEMTKHVNQWVKWLSSLPFYIEEKGFVVVHAGLVPKEKPQYSDPHLLMNIRTWDGQGADIKNETNPPWYKFYKNKKLVVYGHWAKQGLQVRSNTIGLDSACVYGKKLSGVLLPERTIIQVSALQNYSSRFLKNSK
ncbi:MAG: metallophosphoesterase [Oligoflexia bacterium]|nr:metallophosphoesterase [Oligoflexia bacterium]